MHGLNLSESDKLAVQQRAETVLRAFTESLNIANQSKDRGIREYRLQIAREGLIELKNLESKFPFLHLRNLQEVEASIVTVEAETRALPYNEVTIAETSNARSLVGKTVGELQSEPVSAWGNDDIITGLKFSATMQLRTPLRVLLRHGEIHTDRTKPPPRIAMERWEGIWLPVTKSFEEIACRPDSTADDVEFFRRLDAGLARSYIIASDVGPILEENYLPFLIAVRRIVETDDTIEHRIEKLREMPIEAGWQVFVSKHGGIDGIIQRFFPKFINLAAGLDTPNRIAAASDETLLSIKGIGPAKLKAIRERCAGITENRDADRVENVIR